MACGHEVTGTASEINLDLGSTEAQDPWTLRDLPEISLTGSVGGNMYTVLMFDVTGRKLQGFYANFNGVDINSAEVGGSRRSLSIP